jgi:hypothetical protein
MKFRAVSNLDADGFNPATNHHSHSRRAISGQADVKYFDSLGGATQWLLKAGGGGIVYNDADDSVAAVVKPDMREYRGVTQGPDSREESFASAKAAREWLRAQHKTGWVDRYDSVIEKYMPIEKLEAAA